MQLTYSEEEGVERDQEALSKLGPILKYPICYTQQFGPYPTMRELKDFKKWNENQINIYNSHSSSTVMEATAMARL